MKNVSTLIFFEDAKSVVWLILARTSQHWSNPIFPWIVKGDLINSFFELLDDEGNGGRYVASFVGRAFVGK